MSAHIDQPERVDALLISGTWLGVEPGTLERHQRESRSSISTEVVYDWKFGGSDFMAAAADVKAVRMIRPPRTR